VRSPVPLVSTKKESLSCRYALLAQVLELVWVEPFPEKVADVAKDDEDKVAEVGGEKDPPRHALVLFALLV